MAGGWLAVCFRCRSKVRDIRKPLGLRCFISVNVLPSRHYKTNHEYFRNYKDTIWHPSALVITCLGLGISLGYYGYRKKFSIFSWPAVYAAKPDSTYVPGDGGSGYRTKFNFIADVVEKVAPTVVFIEIKDTRRYDFFSGAPVMASSGSGFIVREDGLIVTNAHVVVGRPHNQLQVRLQNGKTFIGVVEDIDVKSDLATVRINCKNLPVMKFAASRTVRPGEFVVALGSPLSLSNTITFGVVSSVSRPSEELGLRGKDMDYIQTDASITFGNSGGPLVNLDGEAIGINSMKVTAGISFAIPIDYAKDFLQKSEERRKAGKRTAEGKKSYYMGVSMMSLTPELLNELRSRNPLMPSDVRHGVLICKVIYGSPAHSRGILPGDIVTHINQKPIRSVSDIYHALESGSYLILTVVRDHGQFDVTVVPEPE